MKIIKKQIIDNDDTYWDMSIPKTNTYVLANGSVVHNCGFGFSVERQYVNQLPDVAEEIYPTDTVLIVRDSKIGWATALKELISMLYNGTIPKWDTSKVRPAGARLKTFGGRASGPEPLEKLFRQVVRVITGAKGRKLNSIECHTILCHIANTVIVGSVRRSALISLSNLTDDRMRRCKTGQWWLVEPDLALSNNSVAYTEKPDMAAFLNEWQSLYHSKSGERGIWNKVGIKKKYIANGRPEYEGDLIPNPCGEVSLRDSGQGCNLSEIIARPGDSLQDLERKAIKATILGTLQATLTNLRFLRKIWQKNMEEERLLGVSITGIMDHPVLSDQVADCSEWSGNPELNTLEKVLAHLRKVCRDTNKEWAAKLGIPSTGHVTVVKPSGCTTLDTKVKTDKGILSLSEIFTKYVDKDSFYIDDIGIWWNIKDKLLVYDHQNNEQIVTKFFDNGLDDIYEIEDESGNTYRFTGNHKLLTTAGEWKRVDKLSDMDEIKSF